jgi:hypothetical protein
MDLYVVAWITTKIFSIASEIVTKESATAH